MEGQLAIADDCVGRFDGHGTFLCFAECAAAVGASDAPTASSLSKEVQCKLGIAAGGDSAAIELDVTATPDIKG